MYKLSGDTGWDTFRLKLDEWIFVSSYELLIRFQKVDMIWYSYIYIESLVKVFIKRY